MSYAYTLDEFHENQFRAELARRERLQAAGLCDYCGRDPSTPTCKERTRHVGRKGAVNRQEQPLGFREEFDD